jgi:hypothetical protein
LVKKVIRRIGQFPRRFKVKLAERYSGVDSENQMDNLQKIFEEQIQKNFTFSVVGAKLIKQKLEAQGISIDDDNLRYIEERLRDFTDDTSSFILNIDDSHMKLFGEDDNRTFTIDLSDSETDTLLEKILNELHDSLANAVPEIVNEITKQVIDSLKCDAPSMLREQRKIRKQFEKRQLNTWKKPLDLLETLLLLALEAGDDYNHEFRQQASEEQDHVFEVLTRLHARACQTSSEILTLLRSGHADGAHARWRSLHEIVVVSSFISEHGDDLAEKYLLHDAVESYKAALLYRQYSELLGYDPIPQDEFDRIKEARDQLVDRFGSSYGNNYGWASSILQKADPTFRDIEESVKLDYLRPLYKLASHNVHANPKGIFFKLGLYPNSRDILLAGPSNTGLADPGHGMAISLTQITFALLTQQPNIDRLVRCNILMGLEREIGELFYHVQKLQEDQDS